MRPFNRFLATLAIPLSATSGWHNLKYNRGTENQYLFENEVLKINVRQSSSPILYPLPSITQVKAFDLQAKIKGALKPSKEKFPSDAYLRVGLVAEGDRRLKWAEKQWATSWIRRLFELVPKDTGLDKIYSFNIVDRRDAIYQERQQPGSHDLIWEKNIALREPTQETIHIKHELKKPLDVVAIWLAADGDDTRSSFQVELTSLDLITE